MVKGHHPLYYNVTKIKLLEIIVINIESEQLCTVVLDELTHLTNSLEPLISKSCLQSICSIGKKHSILYDLCLKVIISVIDDSKSKSQLTQAVKMLHSLLSFKEGSVAKIAFNCVQKLDHLKSPNAKASLINILIDYHDIIPSLCRETYRRLVVSFKTESEVVKISILNLGI
jgi:hypothetical protein